MIGSNIYNIFYYKGPVVKPSRLELLAHGQLNEIEERQLHPGLFLSTISRAASQRMTEQRPDHAEDCLGMRSLCFQRNVALRLVICELHRCASRPVSISFFGGLIWHMAASGTVLRARAATVYVEGQGLQDDRMPPATVNNRLREAGPAHLVGFPTRGSTTRGIEQNEGRILANLLGGHRQ